MSTKTSVEEEWVCVSCGAEVVTDEGTCPRCGSASDPLQDRILAGKYRLIRMLAGGGMGHVYLAEHTRLRYKKMRAIKILKAELLHDNTLRKRFLREVELTHLVSQDNPHIVHIHDDYGFEDGIGFYVMEFLEGDTLGDRIYDSPEGLPMAWTREIGLQLCSAMKSIHDAEIVHRDLKPDNIFLVKDKEGADFVKVMDFGIAKAEHAGTQHTKDGAIVGTVQYLAPEQIRRLPNMPIDGRCDIYAMGCILFEMLAGKAPFATDSGTAEMDGAVGMSMALQNIVMKHLTKPPPNLLQLRPGLSPELVKLIEDMLAKSPNSRPADMGVVAARLKALVFNVENHTQAYIPSPATISANDLKSIETVSSQDISLEGLRRSSPGTAITPPPFGGNIPSGESFASVDSEENQPRSSHTIIVGLALLVLLFGMAFGAYVYLNPQPPSGKTPATSHLGTTAHGAREVRAADAATTHLPTPDTTARAVKETRPDVPKRVTPPVRVAPRRVARRRPRRSRPRRSRRVSLRVPSGYFRRFKLVFSPRKSARLRGNTIIRRGRTVNVEVRARTNSFDFYPCRFALSKRARRLTLKALASKSGLAPDSRRYCLAGWK